jgi:ATP-dependent exoDNAse (exonuclease V) beta subunit
MKWNKKFIYPTSTRKLIEGKRHYDIEKTTASLPSVTTILSSTESPEKREAIAKWKARVGEKTAEEVKNTAATRGTAMHSYLEYHIAGQGLLDLTESGVEAKRMAEVVVEKGLGDLDEIWGSECVLYYPELYAGQTDLCGVYQGRESIVDFKQSNKPKREEYIGDYYLQLVAYAMAHDAIYKTNIEQGVILMCTPDLYFQKFVLNGARFRQVKWEWLRRIDDYYKNKKANV